MLQRKFVLQAIGQLPHLFGEKSQQHQQQEQQQFLFSLFKFYKGTLANLQVDRPNLAGPVNLLVGRTCLIFIRFNTYHVCLQTYNKNE